MEPKGPEIQKAHEGRHPLKTYCKRADPTDLQAIERYAYEAMTGKLKRKDYSEFVAGYCSLS